jgi:hypothetical protein
VLKQLINTIGRASAWFLFGLMFMEVICGVAALLLTPSQNSAYSSGEVIGLLLVGLVALGWYRKVLVKAPPVGAAFFIIAAALTCTLIYISAPVQLRVGFGARDVASMLSAWVLGVIAAAVVYAAWRASAYLFQKLSALSGRTG